MLDESFGDGGCELRSPRWVFCLFAFVQAVRPLTPLDYELVVLVRDGTNLDKLRAALTLYNLAENDDNKVAIATAGGIAPLVALVNGGTDKHKLVAAEALGMLACRIP